MITKQIQQKLFKAAVNSLDYSYAPYSGFKVGAALLTSDNTIFSGCNVENAAYSPSNCAERTAIFKAVSQGYKDFKAIMIVGGPQGKLNDYCSPCGVCRQVMREFCDPKTFEIYLAKSSSEIKVFTLEQLLPESFSL